MEADNEEENFYAIIRQPPSAPMPEIYDTVPVKIQIEQKANEKTKKSQYSVTNFRGQYYVYPFFVCNIPGIVFLRLLALINVEVAGLGFLLADDWHRNIRNRERCIFQPVAGYKLFQQMNELLYAIQLFAAIHCLLYAIFKKTITRAENLPYLNFFGIPYSIFWIIFEGYRVVFPPDIIILVQNLLGYFVTTNVASYIDSEFCVWLPKIDKSKVAVPVVERKFFIWRLGLVDLWKRQEDKCVTFFGVLCATIDYGIMNIFLIVLYDNGHAHPFNFWTLLTIVSCIEWKTFVGFRLDGFKHIKLYQSVLCFGLAIWYLILKNSEPALYYLLMSGASGCLALIEIMFYFQLQTLLKT
ncbi:unnamed protein product [Bursaphelenchus okinawaensis]|uniref:Uncharacterized protein n=1 Tax=Bursaphelenchus okinawaensis TaxID=465554 RepID=A0A811KQ30_9BILA|nr:unnamed protein product [Bursaphelenchus okinawaensis]CAG9107241.1 unnamed protein product [Bursaphelenchus okinawaensis]